MGQNTDPNKKAAGRAIGGALMMIVLGFLAALLPHVMGASASVSLGWIIVVSGFAYFFYAFAASSDGEVLSRMVIGFFYLFGGFYLLGSRDFDPKGSYICGRSDRLRRKLAGTHHLFPDANTAGRWVDSL